MSRFERRAGLIGYGLLAANCLLVLSDSRGPAGRWLYTAALTICATQYAWRGNHRRGERWGWWLGAICLALMALAMPMPGGTGSGLLYALSYPFAYAAIVQIAWRRAPGATWDFCVDGLLGALAMSSVGAAVLLTALQQAHAAGSAVPEPSVALADVLLASTVVTQCVLTRLRIGRDWLMLAAGLIIGAVGDAAAYGSTQGGWPSPEAQLLSLASLAAVVAAGRQAVSRDPVGGRAAGSLAILIAQCSTMLALAVLAASLLSDVPPIASALAVLTLALAAVRTTGKTRALSQLTETHERTLAELEHRRRLQEALARLGQALVGEALLSADASSAVLPGIPALAATLVADNVGADTVLILERSPDRRDVVLVAAHGPVPELGALSTGAEENPASAIERALGRDGRAVHAAPIPGATFARGAVVALADRPLRLGYAEQAFITSVAASLAAWMRGKDAQFALMRTQRMESVGSLAGGIAHDFNNLLGVIVAASDELRAALPSSSAEAELDALDDAARRATDLAKRLLAFSRGDTGSGEHSDLAAVVTATRPLLQRALGNGCRLDLHLTDADCPVQADATQIEQVLVNLCVNARAAMDGVGAVSIALERRTQDGNDGAYLTVSDTGAGMTPEVRARAFDPFFTTKGEAGTGLGLATVYAIVEAAGGAIDLRSRPGVGTTFELRWPLAEPAQPRAAPALVAPAPPAAVPAGCDGPTRLLLVDDEEQLRRILARVLRRHGFEVIEAACAADAIDRLREAPVDIVVTDVLMPGGSGIELADGIEAEWPGLPVLFMSGYPGEGRDRRFEDRLLLKPVTAGDLVARVAGALPHAA